MILRHEIMNEVVLDLRDATRQKKPFPAKSSFPATFKNYSTGVAFVSILLEIAYCPEGKCFESFMRNQDEIYLFDIFS